MDSLDPYSTVAPQIQPLYAAPTAGGRGDPRVAADVAVQPAAGDSRVGRTIGNYIVERELGRGGMGVVYAVKHRQFSDRRYALKLISAASASPLACQRFQQEVEAIGRSRHPNLLYATDAGVHESDPYLVTELVEGHDLGKLLARHGPLPVSVACEIGRQMALGLEFVHATGMVHRDIKPHNVMLQPNGQIKILDLGLAALLGAGGEGGIAGTPVYMPPEQWRGEMASPASDVYSLACTLFEMIAGRPPFPAAAHGTIDAQRAAHLDGVPPRLADAAPHVPADVSRLVDRCLRKPPHERPQGCGEIVAILEGHAAPIDTAKVFEKVGGDRAIAIHGDVHYDQFVEQIRFPAASPRARVAYVAIFAVCVLVSLTSLVLAYFGPWSTSAWELRFDRLGGQTVPHGTGFAIEAIRTVLFLSCVFGVGYTRFQLPLARLFSMHLHTWRIWCARVVLAAVLAVFLGMECSRLWYPENAATSMVAWAGDHGIRTTADVEVVPYRWYLGYALIQYAFIMGALVILPLLQFLLSDVSYVERSISLFSSAQRLEPNAMRAVDRLYSLARHFRRLATRYIDTAGMLALFIHYEYWIGHWTLSETGYFVEVVGMFVTAGIMIVILGYVAARYGEALDVTCSGEGAKADHRIERQVGQFNVVWLIKSAVFSRPSGFAVLSLLLLLLESARQAKP